MNSNTNSLAPRLDYLDAARAFALVLGVVFHASLSFLPTFMGWAVQDVSTSPLVSGFVTISHSFRMEMFFLLAGFFACVTVQRKGAREFSRSRVLRLVVPFVAGWFLLRPLLVSGWVMGGASLRGDYQFWSGIAAGIKSLETLPAEIFTGSHLWFLYYLALITGLALVVRAGFSAVPVWGKRALAITDAFTGWAATSQWAVSVLALPTGLALWFMRYWGMDTPDRSVVPHLPVLAIYGGFFALGWALGRQRDRMEHIAGLSAERWVGAAVGIVGVLWLAPVQGQPSHPNYVAAHIGFVASYAVMMWSLVFLTLGVFRRLCDRPRAWVRYVADSSYWMYLIHLPIVIWLQVSLAEVSLPWAVKLAGISVVSVGIALLTYDLFVRSTWLGGLLNGRRHERVLAAWWRERAPIAPSGEAATS